MVYKRVKLLISGNVQGVFFRVSSKEVADQLGLKGWVRNNPDSTVELFCEGPESDVDQLIAWTQKGPEYARVDNVRVIPTESEETCSDFHIR